MMPNPAFLVEGHMEQIFVANICPGQPVRRIGCNGDQVSMSGIAKHLETHIRLLPNHYPLVIVFDRERREKDCDQLKQELKSELNARGICVGNIVIGIADRTIENWILADPASITEGYPGCNLQPCADGDFGKSILCHTLKPIESYNETTTGVALLKRINPQVARNNNASLNAFLNEIAFDCWWIDQ